MVSDAVTQLRAELDAEPPASLLALLSDEDVTILATLVKDAKHSQSQALQRATDQALSHLPRLVRIAVQRVLG
jgi:hypothetical protein